MKLIYARLSHYIFSAMLALLGGAVLAQPGTSHTALVASTPTANSVLQEFPVEIALEFNEPLLMLGGERSNYFEVLSPLGEKVELGEFSIDQSRIRASVVTLPDIGGVYEISYRVVASDGHVIEGVFSFEFESQISAPTEIKSEAPLSREGTTQLPDGVLIGLILIASIAAVVIYSRAQ